ncbi:MAG: type II toxin-antitoxin system VapC family toxin [Candidatus Contendobacter sp.]
MVIDTSALIAILLDEPDAIHYAEAIEQASTRVMSTGNWLEAALVITARQGESGMAEFRALIEKIQPEIVALDIVQMDLAYQAWRKFGKGRHRAGLNFGDCFAYALAQLRHEPLLFKGDDFTHTDIQFVLSSV